MLKILLNFIKRKQVEIGLFYVCKLCYLNNKKEDYRKNPNKYNERSKRWAKKNRDRVNAKRRERRKLRPYEAEDKEKRKIRRKRQYENNKEKELARCKEYQRKNKEKVVFKKREHYYNNKEYYNKKGKEWRKKHPEKTKEYDFNRRACEKGAQGRCSNEQMQARIDFYGGKCAYCKVGNYEHIDHVIPLSKGGSNWPSNLRPACAKCNLSKNDKSLQEWKRVA